MTRPYVAGKGGTYCVPLVHGVGMRLCNTRAQAGLVATRQRSHHAQRIGPDGEPRHTDGARLAFRATLDLLADSDRTSQQLACKCCGAEGRGKYRLSVRGRRRLLALRAKGVRSDVRNAADDALLSALSWAEVQA